MQTWSIKTDEQTIAEITTAIDELVAREGVTKGVAFAALARQLARDSAVKSTPQLAGSLEQIDRALEVVRTAANSMVASYNALEAMAAERYADTIAALNTTVADLTARLDTSEAERGRALVRAEAAERELAELKARYEVDLDQVAALRQLQAMIDAIAARD